MIISQYTQAALVWCCELYGQILVGKLEAVTGKFFFGCDEKLLRSVSGEQQILLFRFGEFLTFSDQKLRCYNIYCISVDTALCTVTRTQNVASYITSEQLYQLFQVLILRSQQLTLLIRGQLSFRQLNFTTSRILFLQIDVWQFTSYISTCQNPPLRTSNSTYAF